METTQTSCPACGYGNAPGAEVCALCSAPIKRGSAPEGGAAGAGGEIAAILRSEELGLPREAAEPGAIRAPAEKAASCEQAPGFPAAPPPRPVPAAPGRAARRPHKPAIYQGGARHQAGPLGLPPVLFALLFGMLAAGAWALVPGLAGTAVELRGYVHAAGHALAATFMGIPSLPSFGEGPHLGAPLAGWQPAVAGAGLVVFAGFAWAFRQTLWLAIPAALAVPFTALFAFTPIRDVFMLYGGHLGELLVAWLCLWAMFAGGFSQHAFERLLYAIPGFLLLGGVLWVGFGLLFVDSVREWYAGSGARLLGADLLVVADRLVWPLPQVVAPVLLAALALVPAAWGFAHRGRD